MSKVSFYSVKKRSQVEVPLAACWKVKYTKEGASGKTSTRYAVKGQDEGSNLTRFITEAAFKSMKCPEKKA
ncbi:MAG: hypothetical protein RL095_2042 [Verrucomicrobiota bacterium]